MPKKTSSSFWREWADTLTRVVQRFSGWRGGIGVSIFIFVLAVVTRTVNLSSFPYFPEAWPWNGVNGLYIDEYGTSLLALQGNWYFPFFQVTLMKFAISILGYNTFAVRLVSALFSSVTSVLIYLSVYELFRNRLAALVSSLFFIFMTPALIYGRMAFVENGAATFFVLTFLFATKYLNAPRDLWLVGSAVSAALSFLCKQTGIVAIAFLVLFLVIYKPGGFRQFLKPLLIMSLSIFAYLIQVAIWSPSSISQFISTYIGVGIRSVDWFNILVTTSMPTGHSLMWYQFPEMLSYFWNIRWDFWYVLAYFVIIYLLIKEKRSVQSIVLAFSLFILLLILLGHANVYYVALMQPFMAIPVGYGLFKLQEMSGTWAFAFSILLCFPAISYINYYAAYFLTKGSAISTWISIQFAVVIPIIVLGTIRFFLERVGKKEVFLTSRLLLVYYIAWSIISIYIITVFASDAAWVVMQFTVVIPVVVLGMIRLWYKKMSKKEAVIINRFLLVFYVACLIVGSYVMPVFYPGYFAQSSVPI